MLLNVLRFFRLMAMSMSFCTIFLTFITLEPIFGAVHGQCNVSRCSKHGPAIHFPFWLKTVQPEYCGYGKSFELYCNHKDQTVLYLPFSVEVIVNRIDYKSQTIHTKDPNKCFPALLPKLNLSLSSFKFNQSYSSNFSLFNCSRQNIYISRLVPCLSVGNYEVYAAMDFDYHEYVSCWKMYSISSVPYDIYQPEYENKLQLSWLEPDCTECEAQGKICIPKNQTAEPDVQVQCVDMLKTTKGAKKNLVIGLVLGTFLFVLGMMALVRIYVSYKSQKEDQKRIATFLEDYKALKPTRYTFADIKKITKNFKEKLGEGGYGIVFKGKLSSEIAVAVKLLSSSMDSGEEFINEVGTIGRIHHVNVVRLVGFCADGISRALVYELLPNGSLEKFIFSENQKNISLDWLTLQDIALGIAKGIEYLHQGCDHQILHFDIKPHNILLDQNFNPKISDFGLAKLCSKEQSMVSMSAARGTMGYIAPELFSRNFGNVSYKSDVYSFGMLLLEMVGGRKNVDDTVPNTSQIYFPEWVYNRLSNGEEFGTRNIEDEEHAKIAKKLTVVGLWCIQWHPIDRPPMKTVVQMLEGKGDTLTMPPNPFGSSAFQMDCPTRPPRALHTELEAISEAE